eukprot:g3628.t1
MDLGDLLRRSTRRLFNIATRVYIDRIVVRGRRNLPLDRPFILAGNHPSGLLDALVLMTAFPKVQMSGVAKDSLFKIPAVGTFLNIMRAVPVAKPYDPDKPESEQLSPEERKAMNQRMFDVVERRLLDEKINISIFPEGTCTSREEIQTLKSGTARMALEVAVKSGGKTRVPIVPVGLSYTQTSGRVFRSSVLVDVGRPIEVTDEILDNYMNGGARGQDEALDRLTSRLESHLRYVTIAVPDWRKELMLYCERNGIEPPEYSEREVNAGRKVFSEVVVGDRSFRSDAMSVPKIKGTRRVGSSLTIRTRRLAARRAFFRMSGAEGYDVFGDSDTTFIENIHLSRHIYKPDGVRLTLGQFTALSRNFMHGYLRTPALNDPDFLKLWSRVDAYRKSLTQLGFTDKHIAMFAAGTGPMRQRIDSLRAEALGNAGIAAVVLPISIVGTVLHMPLAALAYYAGRRWGIDDDGDESVIATVTIIAGFFGILGGYPILGAAALAATGSPASSAAIVAAVGASGFIAAEHSALPQIRNSLRMTFQRDAAQKLVDERTSLKTEIRRLVDRYASDEMRGWWKKPMMLPKVFVRHGDIDRAGLVSLSIPLNKGTRNLNERAVLTIKQRTRAGREDRNRTALLWIPGRNDSFYHVHVLEDIVEKMGMDLFAIDLRRCGRAKLADDNVTQTVPPLLAHDSYNFEEYFEELDAAISLLKRPGGTIDASKTVQESTSGTPDGYKNVVVYAHSTGGLVAALYAHKGSLRKHIDGYIFNSPFWEWNQPWYEQLVLKNSALRSLVASYTSYMLGTKDATGATDASRVGSEDDETPKESVALSAGGGVSEFSEAMHLHYKFPELLKSRRELAVTAGWAAAVTNVQRLVASREITLRKPALVLYTDADTVLSSEDIDRFSDCLNDDGRTDGQFLPMSHAGVVERKIDSNEWAPSGHDVLAAPSSKRVKEAMSYMIEWAGAHFPVRKS